MESFRVKLDLAAIHGVYTSGGATPDTVTSVNSPSVILPGQLQSSNSLADC